ncbi:MAG: glucose-1-phosphate cytidylyltransferase [Promethearchaeota archaeon]
MKVIILAGGWGTRLGNLTELIPKPMVNIGTKPILWHIMKIYSFYGFNDFIICLGVKADVIKDYFYHYKTKINDFTINLSNDKIEFYNKQVEQWRVTLIDTGLNTLKGGRIKRVEKYLDPGINMVTYGDGLADINILELTEFHKSHKKLCTITGVHKPARFGELIEKDGIVYSFREKPHSSHGLINGGFMVFNNELLEYLTTDEICDLERGVLDELSLKGEVMVFKHKGKWECMDHERDVNYLNKLWNSNKAFWKVWE